MKYIIFKEYPQFIRFVLYTYFQISINSRLESLDFVTVVAASQDADARPMSRTLERHPTRRSRLKSVGSIAQVQYL